MEFVKENAVEFTKYAIEEYYHLNIKPLASVLTEDCVWIGPDNVILSGSDVISKVLKNNLLMSSFSIEDAKFRYLDDKEDANIVVVGEYLLFSEKENKRICICKQRLTSCYHTKQEKYLLYHMHISNEWIKTEKFLSKDIDIYHYIQKLLKNCDRKKEDKITIKTNNSTYFVNLDMILYIEAIDKSSIIHMINQNLTINRPIKIMEEIFPDYYYRCHRSYIVNCSYIERIERYSITLVTGTVIPVPEKRYREVREKITEIMQDMIKEKVV